MYAFVCMCVYIHTHIKIAWIFIYIKQIHMKLDSTTVKWIITQLQKYMLLSAE